MPTYCSPSGRISEVTEHQRRDVLVRAKETFYNLSTRLVVFHAHSGSRSPSHSSLFPVQRSDPAQVLLGPGLGLFLVTTWDPHFNRIQVLLLGTLPYVSLANIHPVLISMGPLWLHPDLGRKSQTQILCFQMSLRRVTTLYVLP